MLAALKNIHAKTVKLKVIRIDENSLKRGKKRPTAIPSKLFLLLFVSNKGKKYIAFKAPQTINVQLAQCQKPLTINIIKVFLIFIHSPPLLPPKGI